ncbi:MAG: cytochrome c biogenesis protein CcsA [Candidatus Cloacimonetes bacterium]|nr:cytochrome c biogenesis protein CcsA [Candidatus Cloacimonadota bacterium]
MKNLFIILSLLFAFQTCTTANQITPENLILQHSGRLKPLDTFSKYFLLGVYSKSKIKGLSSSEWLKEALVDETTANTRTIFFIRNPEVIHAYGLKMRKDRKYSFDEIFQTLGVVEPKLNELEKIPKEKHTLTQKQMLETYYGVLRYYYFNKSLNCFFPQFELKTEKIAKLFQRKKGDMVSYYFFLNYRDQFDKALTQAEQTTGDEIDPANMHILQLAAKLGSLYKQSRPTELKVIPADPTTKSEQWLSPWEIILNNKPSEFHSKYLNLWNDYTQALISKDEAKAQALNKEIYSLTDIEASKQMNTHRLTMEVMYNNAKLFQKSIAFLILSFILISLSFLMYTEAFQRWAFRFLILGTALQGVGLCLRMYIRNRPPVSTLYESIIFVSFVAGVCGIIMEHYKRNGLNTLLTNISCIILLFISFGYEADGDTMGMLVAVLDSNFWLATHVVTITIGYGCSFVAGGVGHLYLIYRIFNPMDKQTISDISKNMRGTVLVAVFFTTFGTILGGIWADQSWGRFWGWDPKENGALLIVLWQLLILHAKLGGRIRDCVFAAGLVINNIVVALAWFGVNLLNVGLHSYGFTDSIAYSLAGFAAIEIIFALITCPLARRIKPGVQTS